MGGREGGGEQCGVGVGVEEKSKDRGRCGVGQGGRESEREAGRVQGNELRRKKVSEGSTELSVRVVSVGQCKERTVLCCVDAKSFKLDRQRSNGRRTAVD